MSWLKEEKEEVLEESSDEVQWLDYEEDELDAAMKDDLDLILKKSPEAQEQVRDFQKIKAGLNLVKDQEEPSNEYFVSLHEKIMSQVSQAEIEKNPTNDLRETEQNSISKIPTYLMMGGVAALFVAVISVLTLQRAEVGNKNIASEKEWLLKASSENPEGFTDSVIATEDKEELLLKMAEDKLNKMDKEKSKKVVDEIFKDSK